VGKPKVRWWTTFLALSLAFGLAVKAAEHPANVAGKWEMSWESRQGTISADLVLEQDGEKLKGTMSGPGGRETPLTGTMKGKSITLVARRETPRGEFTVEYKGKVDGDSMQGSAEMGQFSMEWSAKRKK